MKCLDPCEDQSLCTHVISPVKDCNNKNSRRKAIKKRKRKSIDQLKFLSQEFQISTEWDKENIARLSKKTGLSEAQIYKWSWEQKKKVQIHTNLKIQKNAHLSDIFFALPDVQFHSEKKEYINIKGDALNCSEIISPRSIDFDFYSIQKNYRLGLEIFSQAKSTQNKFPDSYLQELARN